MKKLKFILFVVSVMLFSNCSPRYYIPTQQVTPTFKEKGDVFASGTVSGEEFTGGSIAAAVTDQLSFQVNGVLKGPETKQLEAAVGYYYNLHERVNFNCFLGYGQATVRDNPEEFRMTFQRAFVQPSLAYTSKNFEAILSLKASRLFYDVDLFGVYDEDFHENLLTYDRNSYTVLEPGLTLRYGFKYLKLQFQTIDTKQMTNKVFEMQDSDFSLGLVFQYPLFKSRTKKYYF